MADEEKQKSGGGKKKLIFIIIGVVLLILVGIAAFLLGTNIGGDSGSEATAGADKQEDMKADVGPMVDIDDFIINILDKDETRYLKAAITLELDGEETVIEVNERMAQIRDAILLLIGNKTFAELSDLQGKLQLRAEIIARLNKLLKDGKVKGIYFTEFVVQ